MKQLLLLVALMTSSVAIWAQTDKVVIMDVVDRETQITYNTKLMLRSCMAELVSQTDGFEAYDRFDFGQTIDEYEFQRTGYLSSDDIKKIGRLAGVQHILVIEASQLSSNKLFITAKVLNVKTTNLEKTANVTTKTDTQALQQNAKTLVNELFLPKDESDFQQKTMAKEGLSSTQSKYEIRTTDKVLIERVRQNEYKYGDTWFTRQEYYQFINNRDLCIPAYQQFNKGLVLEEIGKWTLISGGGCLLIGTLVTAIGVPVNKNVYVQTYYVPTSSYDRPNSGTYDGMYIDKYSWIRKGTSNYWYAYGNRPSLVGCAISGSVLMGIGAIAMITGGSLWCVGVHKKDYAFESFNEYCATDKQISTIFLNLQVSENGLGLALHF